MPRYGSSTHVARLRILFAGGASLSLEDIAARLECSRSTAERALKAVHAAGEPLVEEQDGFKKRWRLMPGAKQASVRVTTSQMVALLLSRGLVGAFAGTGIAEDLEDVFATLHATLKRTDAEAARDLERKVVFVVSEGRRRYEGRSDDVDDLLTALLRQEQVDARHASVEGGRTAFQLRPYTLLVYRGGLYFAGWTSHRDAVRTFALDGFTNVERRRGERFEYPNDFAPQAIVGDAFGLIRGPRTRVVLRFDASAAPYVRRRVWHASQQLDEESDGAVRMTLEIEGTVEVKSWILGWGAQVEVVEPAALREELRRAGEAIATRHGRVD
ncbi:MAG: helix-turn-helix transcriptional regulator [Polyangiales bacterium]